MIEEGYCQCGCGTKTTVPTYSRANKGIVKGKPLKWARGHHSPRRLIGLFSELPCSICKRTMSTENFPIQGDTYSSRCKECLSFKRREVLYGIDRNTFEALRVNQRNRCAICRNKFQEDKRIHVDHNHKTGAVRALLCGSCNQGLGYFKDDTLLLERAIVYIQRHDKSKEHNS